jgi:putative endonuclease
LFFNKWLKIRLFKKDKFHVKQSIFLKNVKKEAKHLRIGRIGERAVANHLKRKGFTELESNFRTKTGEIDLIFRKEEKVYFVEVKTVSVESGRASVSYETEGGGYRDVSRGIYRPEDNVHHDKLRKILNTIQVWISLNKYEGLWQLDIASVYLDLKDKRAQVRFIENIIVE